MKRLHPSKKGQLNNDMLNLKHKIMTKKRYNFYVGDKQYKTDTFLNFLENTSTK